MNHDSESLLTEQRSSIPETANESAPFLFEGGHTAVLLLHGFSNTPHDVYGLGKFLSQHGFTAQGILLPGHGTEPSDLNRTTWRDWYGAVDSALLHLRQQGHDRLFVVGLSLGGLLALRAASQKEVDGVVALVAGVTMNPAWHCAVHVLKHFVPEIPKGRIPLLKKAIPVVKDPEAAKSHVSYKKHALRAIDSLHEFQHHVFRDLPGVACPVKLIYSRYDPLVAPGDADLVRAGLPLSDEPILWVDNSYHVITIDYDKFQVYQAVHDFVKRHASR